MIRRGCDLVFVYTYCQAMYRDILNQTVPAGIAEIEESGEHYSIGSVWMGLIASTAAVGASLSFDFTGTNFNLALIGIIP